MANDLISRQAAIDTAKRLHDVAWANWKETKISANTMIDALKDLPSAEPEKICIGNVMLSEETLKELVEKAKAEIAQSNLTVIEPEIIRCKDCKNWDTTWQNDWAKNYHYCPFIDGTREGDWYCADAERRTDE